jgi:hypothetical protein
VSQLCGLPALNLIDHRDYDALLDLLREKLGIQE